MTDVALRTGPADLTAITDGQIDTLVRLASNLAASGMFKDAKRGEEAFAKLVFGRDLGLGATQALTEVHIVDGKPELSANLQASMLKVYVGPEGERYDFRKPDHTNERCVLMFRKRERGGQWEDLGDSTFTLEDAKTAGLVRANSPWTKYPRNMLFARAMSNGVAWYCPEVTGGVRVFSPGEIGGPVTTENVAVDDEPVEVVDAEVVEPDDAPKSQLAEDTGPPTVPEREQLTALILAHAPTPERAHAVLDIAGAPGDHKMSVNDRKREINARVCRAAIKYLLEQAA